MVGSDYNVIIGEKEKLGGLPVYPHEVEDFAFCINPCELYDITFSRSPFTWWNGWSDGACIFKRLDRVVVNQGLLNLYGNIDLKHLDRTGSDHATLLLSCGSGSQVVAKPFKFLKFLVKGDNFK